MDAILRAENLTIKFNGTRAADNLTCELARGKITAVIGPNGSGKTTLFNLITGFVKPEAGRILLNGDHLDIKRLTPDKIARLGIVRTFQNIRLFQQMTVLENVMLGMKYNSGDSLLPTLFLRKRVKQEDLMNLAKAEQLLKRVTLLDKRQEQAQNLSHGQRRLLEIARALAMDPKILLLDEPTAGLFPEMIVDLKEIMNSMKREGRTIVFIEHDMKVVMDISDQIIVLDHGQKIAEGSPQEIQNDQAVISSYLGKPAPPRLPNL